MCFMYFLYYWIICFIVEFIVCCIESYPKIKVNLFINLLLASLGFILLPCSIIFRFFDILDYIVNIKTRINRHE